MPTIAPTESPPDFGSTTGRPGTTDPVAFGTTDTDTLGSAVVAGFRNNALNFSSPLSFAGLRSAGAHSPSPQALLAQHPTNGGLLNLQVYQMRMLSASAQSWRGRSSYVSGLKEDERRLATGQAPSRAVVHGSTVQQPRKGTVVVAQTWNWPPVGHVRLNREMA